MIATFTQAMSSTEPAAASRTARRGCRRPNRRVRSDSAPSDHLPEGYGRGLRLLQVAGDAGEVVAGLIQGHAGASRATVTRLRSLRSDGSRRSSARHTAISGSG